MNKSRARFNLVVDANRMVIEIVDVLGVKSVTNDAEAVIEGIASLGIAVDDYTIVYRDTMCVWCGLKTKGGKFTNFIVLTATDPDTAVISVQRAKRRT